MESLEDLDKNVNIIHRVTFFAERYIECECGQCFTSLVDYGLHTMYYVKAVDPRNGTEFIRAKGYHKRKGGRPKGIHTLHKDRKE